MQHLASRPLPLHLPNSYLHPKLDPYPAHNIDTDAPCALAPPPPTPPAQIQERLTNQIARGLWGVLKPRGVAVIVECSHMCMCMRGVRAAGSSTVTSAVLGSFRSDFRTRQEFFANISMGARTL